MEHMEESYLAEKANDIKSIIDSGFPISWSWGPDDFRAVIYKDMAALRFSVIGKHHQGDVIVAYNGGADLFDVYCLNDNEEVICSRERVYFNELVDVIDAMVEK